MKSLKKIIVYFVFFGNNGDCVGFVDRRITDGHFPGAEVDGLLLDVETDGHFVPHFEFIISQNKLSNTL